METEDVSKEVEWEAKRVALAFGVIDAKQVEGWAVSLWLRGMVHIDHKHTNVALFVGHLSQYNQWDIEWCINSTGWVTDIGVGERRTACVVKYRDGNWHNGHSYSNAKFHIPMVRGLYRLGSSDDVQAKLNYFLTAHEKLELRLSLPREFWPQRWLDEEDPRRG